MVLTQVSALAKRRLFKRDRGPIGTILHSRFLSTKTRFTRPDSTSKLWKRAHVIHHLPKGGKGVEVGVNRARFSEVLLTECKPERVWFVDPWFEEDIRAIALATLSRFPNAVVLQETSEAAVSRFDDESLDWIYIDGSHEYEDVRHDLRAWAPKIRSGGVIAGDDYYWRNAAGDYSVKKAVDEFLVDAPVSRWFMVAGQFVMTKA